MIKTIAILSALLSTSALAAWSSGGGEALNDIHNPWFMSNTKTVNYCFQHSPDFGVDISTSRNAFREALTYWRGVLQNPKVGSQSPQWRLATQLFSEQPCNSSDVDLKIQLGLLDAKQLDYISDPTRFVGITVRTDYDRKNLRAKGFMYIAPENGKWRITRDAIKEYWSEMNGLRLKWLFAHELGHVFGVRFNSSSFDLMSPWFAHALISKVDNLDVARLGAIKPYFSESRSLPTYLREASVGKNSIKFFQLEKNNFDQDLSFFYRSSDQSYRVESDSSEVGRLFITNHASAGGTTTNEINIIFPQEQKIFKIDRKSWPIKELYSSVRWEFVGYYQPNNGSKDQPLMLTWDGREFRSNGMYNDEMNLRVLSSDIWNNTIRTSFTDEK